MCLIILKFTRLSRPLALFYRLLERPLPYLIPLLTLLSLVYTSLAYLCQQLWGVSSLGDNFRRLNKSLYSLLTLFTQHSDQVYFFIHPLYRFNQGWAGLVVLVHLVFMQYTFMNVVAAVIFEEHRIAEMIDKEASASWKEGVMRRWLRSAICCIKNRDNKKEENQEVSKEINSLKERSREERERRKRRREERSKNYI